MKKLYLPTLLLIFILTSAFGQKSNLTFSDWDENSDAFISRSEFVNVFKENYVNDWNVVDDAHLDDEDFYLATYRVWDIDNDEIMTEEEWIMGYDYDYGDYLVDEFVAYDIDGDGFIEYTEFYDAITDTDYFMVWDLDEDNYLSEGELARAVFNHWDTDNSSFIEMDEYNMLDAYYLDF